MAEQGTAARFIEVATAELGTIEGPKDNETSMVLSQKQTSNHGVAHLLCGALMKQE